jgi:hypothetical protein
MKTARRFWPIPLARSRFLTLDFFQNTPLGKVVSLDRLTPMRNLMRRSSGNSGSRSSIPRCISTAHRTASTTLWNSARNPSPVFFTIPAAVLGDLGVDQLPEVRGEALVSALFVTTHQARIPRHVGGKDRGEAADRGGQIGFSDRSGYTAIGTVCNLAARLCAEAKDGHYLARNVYK